MNKRMETQKGHVVVLTYPAQGHINPLLQFAKRLASKGLKATLATTPYTVKSIHAEPAGVQVEPISDGFDEGGYKQAPSLQAYMESFKQAGSRTLAELIKKFSNTDAAVICIVYDSMLTWAVDVARELNIYSAAFVPVSATVFSLFRSIHHGHLHLPVNPQARLPSLPGLPPLDFSDLPSFIAEPVTHSAYLTAIMEQQSIIEENDWVFGNTFEELESELAKAMSSLWPMVMIGPMVPSAYLDQQIEGDTSYGASLWNPTSDHYLKWLDTKPLNSVIYVSFGSMVSLAANQVEEIAYGLKASNRHFLWIMKDHETEKLSMEFLRSIDDSGLILNWCNQLEVLSHWSIGCYITHCGWNSILEGLSLGVPMVGVPQWSDQPTNAKFVEDVWRVGKRAKTNEEGVVSREEIEKCISKVMVGESSEEIKRSCCQWRESARRAVSKGGSSDKNIDAFIGALLKKKSKSS
ncbi:UDP-glucuronosyl/UDP-glucosyltransferase [Dillenia turbinata]|uniref:Glycosyltransferase n=1 Tax=Dillenia turbinata TaxID=194707 RepID=A0AAN8V3J4_9MAGN